MGEGIFFVGLWALKSPTGKTGQLKRFFKNTQNKITQIYIPEIITIILFALGHKYLGIFAVINACIACVILRICYIKTKNIFAGTIAHFMYNFVSLLLFLI